MSLPTSVDRSLINEIRVWDAPLFLLSYFLQKKSVILKRILLLKSMKYKKTVLLLWKVRFPPKSSEWVGHNCWFQERYVIKSAVVCDPLWGQFDDFGGKLTISQW